MEYITGKNFMFYVECQTLTGSVMIPLCSAETVQLGQQTRSREVTKAPKGKSSRWAYGIIDGSLSIDGLVPFSATDIQNILVEVNNKLLETNDKLVTIGSTPAGANPYFCLENALNEWKYIDWICDDDNGNKYSGVALVSDINNTWTPNDNRKFSCSCLVDGDIQRFHTPIPTNLRLESQSNTIPTETATFVENGSDSQVGAWTQRFLASGVYLPNGVFGVSIYGDNIEHVVQPGDTLEEIVQGLASQITAKKYEPVTPPPTFITAGTNDDTLEILMDEQHSATSSYTNHTGTLRSVYISYSSVVDYDFYRVKVVQGLNTWFIDVGSKTPTLILPIGTFTISVSGMGLDLTYSDYSDTIQITIN